MFDFFYVSDGWPRKLGILSNYLKKRFKTLTSLLGLKEVGYYLLLETELRPKLLSL